MTFPITLIRNERGDEAEMGAIDPIILAFAACQNLPNQFVGGLLVFSDAMLFLHMTAPDHAELELVFFLEFTTP